MERGMVGKGQRMLGWGGREGSGREGEEEGTSGEGEERDSKRMEGREGEGGERKGKEECEGRGADGHKDGGVRDISTVGLATSLAWKGPPVARPRGPRGGAVQDGQVEKQTTKHEGLLLALSSPVARESASPWAAWLPAAPETRPVSLSCDRASRQDRCCFGFPGGASCNEML